MNCPKTVMFDLDDTLNESLEPPKPEVLERLKRLLELIPIAIISGGSFYRIERDILSAFADLPRANYLYILPNNAARCYVREEKAWKLEYDFKLTVQERASIIEEIGKAVDETGVIEKDAVQRPEILDREASVVWGAIGFQASALEKASWDPDLTKRTKLRDALLHRIPDFEVSIGGTIMINITRKGINKAYGVQWFAQRLNIEPAGMLFVGDALYEGGNDAVVIPTGIQTRQVAGPQETLEIIDELCAACAVK
ncbi:hypothetical protein A3H16_01470 [Candidatus Kaiserbacteria bacterium RIFCSPLOWO2_12_FULL_53_8]|uniref:phosphomannomutase n=2 Tax=Candidatus Kaiseribacteriota TaxID=1752734 RepID=A0A1F6CUQ1_9BACT|nr:MAG: hypothetical protein A2851_04380 [Candidatus Kaiserbacteria bacterium RIFCSPHIGHO2_01_FULL_53_29]OGG92349.1 MAG: hypothetical protein A3H16_01470 [Candidatus Kaiserbacteria bacterium RIFCSPLOWO2_12_FULL_53_8]